METSTTIGYICSGSTGIFIGFFMALYYVKKESKKRDAKAKEKPIKKIKIDYEMIPYRE